MYTYPSTYIQTFRRKTLVQHREIAARYSVSKVVKAIDSGPGANHPRRLETSGNHLKVYSSEHLPQSVDAIHL